MLEKNTKDRNEYRVDWRGRKRPLTELERKFPWYEEEEFSWFDRIYLTALISSIIGGFIAIIVVYAIKFYRAYYQI